jgi:hypothetical protein
MMRGRRIALAAALVLAAASVGWLAVNRGAATAVAHPSWAAAKWPFPIDEWGFGKAFRCAAADCGSEVNVYLRAKIGFCNCTTGVADDAELERLSDFELLGGKAEALAGGRPINVAWMTGRSRLYALQGPARGQSMLAAAFSSDCDALVATAVLDRGRSSAVEPQVMAFLNSETVAQWARGELGLARKPEPATR